MIFESGVFENVRMKVKPSIVYSKVNFQDIQKRIAENRAFPYGFVFARLIRVNELSPLGDR